MNRYRASATLEAFIIRSAPPHIAVANAPSTEAELAAMVLSLKPGQPIPVWSGGSEHTIYSAPEVNYAFRAWHDSIHIALGAGFDAKGELTVARRHVFEASIRGNLPDSDLRALWADTWGQFSYAQELGGTFPTDQAAFVASRLAA